MPTVIRIIQILTAVMALFFLLGVAVQYNDPDPLRWMAIYGAACASCVAALLRRLPRAIPISVGAAAAIWAVAIAQDTSELAPSLLFHEMRMASLEIEEGRELFGLLLIAGWMAVISLVHPLGVRKER